MFIAALFTIARAWKQPRYQQMNGEEVVVHVHNGILLSHKRIIFESVLMRWMYLDPIKQNKVSQKEKDKYHILMHIYGI